MKRENTVQSESWLRLYEIGFFHRKRKLLFYILHQRIFLKKNKKQRWNLLTTHFFSLSFIYYILKYKYPFISSGLPHAVLTKS